MSTRRGAKSQAKEPPVDTVAIIGSGIMGRGIAVACLVGGMKVKLIDKDPNALTKSVSVVGDILSTFSKLGLISRTRRTALIKKLSTHSDFKRGMESVQLAIESVPEDLELKKKVFAEMDANSDPSVNLATNTSGLSISSIASATRRSHKVIGIHFFAPAYILRAVEVVRGSETSDETVEFASKFVEKIGKVPVMVEKDSPNFVLNSIQFAMIAEARRLLEQGVIKSITEVDKAIRDSFPVRQSLFGLFLDSDLISPYSSLTHPGRTDLKTNYSYEKDSDALIRMRDESLLMLLKQLDGLRKADLGRVSPLLTFGASRATSEKE